MEMKVTSLQIELRLWIKQKWTIDSISVWYLLRWPTEFLRLLFFAWSVVFFVRFKCLASTITNKAFHLISCSCSIVINFLVFASHTLIQQVWFIIQLAIPRYVGNKLTNIILSLIFDLHQVYDSESLDLIHCVNR